MIRPGFAVSAAGLLAAAVFFAAPVAAKEVSDIGPEISLGEIFDTYKLVCVAHPRDPEGQIAAVKALPDTFRETSQEPDGTRTFRSGKLMVRVLDSKNVSMCGVSGAAPASTKSEDGARIGSELFGDPSKLNERSYYWSRGKGPDLVTYVFSLYNRPDWQEAAFLMGSEK